MASPEAQQQEQAKSGLGWNSHTRAAHAQGGPLGRVPARLPRLLGACPAALGSVALPEGEAGQPLPRVLELVDAARTRRRSRRLPDDAGTWTRRRRRWSRTTRATCPTPTWRCAAASRPTAEGRRSASPNPNQPLTTHHSPLNLQTSNLQPSTFTPPSPSPTPSASSLTRRTRSARPSRSSTAASSSRTRGRARAAAAGSRA